MKSHIAQKHEVWSPLHEWKGWVKVLRQTGGPYYWLYYSPEDLLKYVPAKVKVSAANKELHINQNFHWNFGEWTGRHYNRKKGNFKDACVWVKNMIRELYVTCWQPLCGKLAAWQKNKWNWNRHFSCQLKEYQLLFYFCVYSLKR